MAQVLREGFELPAGLTVLVGENGSGKSTVVEMLAEAYGLNPQGGSALAQLFRTRDSEPGIGSRLTVVRGQKARWSYFLRADTMHTFCVGDISRRQAIGGVWGGVPPGAAEHLLDEPDAPVSFTASLGLAALLHDLAAGGSQLQVASHSPILAAIPGANLIELGPWGMRPASWDDLGLVISWRQFLNHPESFFRHLLSVSP